MTKPEQPKTPEAAAPDYQPTAADLAEMDEAFGGAVPDDGAMDRMAAEDAAAQRGHAALWWLSEGG